MKRLIIPISCLLLISLAVGLSACVQSPPAIATLAATAVVPILETIDSAPIDPSQVTLSQADIVSTSTVATEVAYAAVVASQSTPIPTVPPTETPTPTVTPTPTPAPPITYTYRIVNTYPHDPEAFTQGLVYYDGLLYEGTGRWGESTLREVTLETGSVIRSHALDPQYFGEGIALLNDKIYQLTWQEQTGFVYDRANFNTLQTFNYPTEGWGITHDGQRLIVSDGTSTLYFWDPNTLEEIDRITVRDHQGPLNRLNELEYIDGEIWANIWMTDLIARISPETGAVLGYVDLTGLLDMSALTQPVDVLNGIAHDPQTGRIFVTGKLWPTLFEIEVIPAP
ncbi:MAG: glutaminyl-peptide cyclotransferase [Candidatus Promineofilum sp.]|nr:glutaminyl-peptide cyclotransferase [Promineifilum sp.]